MAKQSEFVPSAKLCSCFDKREVSYGHRYDGSVRLIAFLRVCVFVCVRASVCLSVCVFLLHGGVVISYDVITAM